MTLARPAVFVGLLLVQGCAQKLPARALPAFASYDAWCAQLKGAKCRGEWPDAKAGSFAQGSYRFVVIEAGAIDNFGGGPSVSLELTTPHGVVYEPMGAIGSTGRSGTTTLNVESVSEHGGTLDVRTHSRMVSTTGMADTAEAILFAASSGTVAVAHVHLGTNSRDELGRAKGQFGALTWNGTTLVSSHTSLKDGEYRLVVP